MEEEKKFDEEKVRELVGSILSHPSFHETLNNVFNVSLSSSETPSRPPLLGSSSSAASSSRYTTPAEEFSALFRRGSSRGRTFSATFQRGVSHRPSSQQAQHVQGRRRTASAPLYSSQLRNNRPRRREEIFRTKNVVLLTDCKAERTVRLVA